MLKNYLLLTISILFNSTSLILLKKGILNANEFIANLNRLSSWIHLFTNAYILLSILFFSAAVITWILVLNTLDLSLAYPAVSISYVIIAIASYFIFNETITINRWIGIGIIIVGVFVMFQK